MKKKQQSISSPDELNKALQYTSPLTWIILGLSICALVAFFVWSSIYKLKIKISGVASVKDGNVVLSVNENDLAKLKEGQKVYINDLEGTITSISDNKPVVSNFDLADGEYNYTVIINEVRPIDFLFNK